MARLLPILLVLGLSPLPAGCITLGLGSGLAVTPSSADAAVAPTFGVDLGVAIELPHHLQGTRPPSPRTVRIAAGIGSSMTGLTTDQGAVNAMTGPIFVRTDATFVHLGPRALLRATALLEGPGWDLERDPRGAIGAYDVPNSTVIGALAGVTLELPTERHVALLVTTGLRMHSIAGDQLETMMLFGPELRIAADIDVMRVFAGARE
jgi:hypothetical protein